MKFRSRRSKGKRIDDATPRGMDDGIVPRLIKAQIIAAIVAFLTVLPSVFEQSRSGNGVIDRVRPDSGYLMINPVPRTRDSARGHVHAAIDYYVRGPRGSVLEVDLGLARVRYTTYDSLFVDEPRFFSVSIIPKSDSSGVFEVPPVLDEKDDQYAETDSVRVGSVMRAELAGWDFEIEPTGDTPDQPVTIAEPTVWAWMVEPKEVGAKEMVLTLSVVMDVDGRRLPKVLRVFRQPIHVVALASAGPPVEFKTAAAFQASPEQQQDTNPFQDNGTASPSITPPETGRSSIPIHYNPNSVRDPGEVQSVATPNDGGMSAGLIGVIFLGVLLLFLMVAYYHPPNSPYAYSILKLISAICGGFAGGFLTGEAVVKISNDVAAGGLQYALSGTAGFGLFLVIWMFFPPPPQDEPAPAQVGENGFNYMPPEGCTFELAAKLIAKSRKAVVRLQGFTEIECRAVLDSQEIHANDAAHALKLLRDLAPRGQVREYGVSYSDSVYTMTVR